MMGQHHAKLMICRAHRRKLRELVRGGDGLPVAILTNDAARDCITHRFVLYRIERIQGEPARQSAEWSGNNRSLWPSLLEQLPTQLGSLRGEHGIAGVVG